MWCTSSISASLTSNAGIICMCAAWAPAHRYRSVLTRQFEMRALATAFSWFPGKMVEKANGRATRAVPGLAGTINSRSGSIFLASPRCRAPTTMTSGQRLSVNIASGAGACGQLPSSLFECHREREARETQFGLHSMSTDPSVNAALYLSRSGGRKLGSALLVSCKAWGAVMPQRWAFSRPLSLGGGCHWSLCTQ